MAKLFVVSDLHSYYTPFIKALEESGYNENNPEHWLIVCGDLFDRGTESFEILNFFKERDRCILIKGNHEDLIMECTERGYFESHDIHNGTVRTIMTLGRSLKYCTGRYCIPIDQEKYEEAAKITHIRLHNFIGQMLNFFETKKYIFVHSWIPLAPIILAEDIREMGSLAFANPKWTYNADWREASKAEWSEARWANPFQKAQQGLNQTGKTIVFGHYHTSYFHAQQRGISEFGADACFDIAYDTQNNVIGIDACTAHSNQCNILVLEDDFLDEQV